MNKTEQMGAKRRRSLQTLVCVALALTMQVNAYGQSYADCETVKYAVKSKYDAKSLAIKEKGSQTSSAADAAMSCIDSLKMALNFAMPTSFSFSGISIEAILSFLAKKACQVVLEEVKGITAPINQVVGNINDVTQGAASAVNGASNSVGGGNVVVGGGNAGSFSVGPMTPAPAAAQSLSIWDRIASQF